MSEKNEDDAALAEDEAPAETGPRAEAGGRPETPPARPGAGIAWLALVVALAAFVAAGYSAFTDWREARTAERRSDPLPDLRSRIADTGEALARLEEALAGLESADARVASQLDLLRQDLDARVERLDSLPPRIATLESALASLQGISTGARNAWLLAEAEYYLQIANAQLQLANNPGLAALALRMADERVAQVGDPALTAVRGTIADEIAALDGLADVDVEGITLTLASLARVVDGLPLRPAADDAGAAGAAPDEDAGGLDRAWASVKGVAGSLVRHSRPGADALPLMTPEDEYFLRTNLTLQLQAARLALLQGEQSVFRQSLDDAGDWLGTYFDPASAQVASAAETIAEIRATAVSGAKPDISESLRLLRQFRTLTEPAQ